MATCGVDAAPTVLLASSSPRRAELLNVLGIEPTIIAAHIDESPHLDEAAIDLVARLALEKAAAGWQAWAATQTVASATPRQTSGWMVIAADTVVEIDGSILGKPEGKPEAEQMLRILSGNKHRVYTGVAVGLALSTAVLFEPLSAVETTNVVMRTLDTKTIAWYTTTGEPLDKAGAYGIQGKGSLLVDHIEGSYQNVVGLPVTTVDRLCRQLGWPLYEMAEAHRSSKVAQ